MRELEQSFTTAATTLKAVVRGRGAPAKSSARFNADVAAGHSKYLARDKERSENARPHTAETHYHNAPPSASDLRVSWKSSSKRAAKELSAARA